MPKHRPRSCRRCGLTPDDPLDVSYNGVCRPCGETAEAENARQIANGEGEYHDRWREGIKRHAASL